MASDRDIVVRTRDLTKVYRLYRRPQQKFLDMLGLLRKPDSYSEHCALDGVIEPTSGSLEVRGDARALLEITSGFHPEFSGRDNAKAYLAQLGVAGPEAE